MGFADEYLQKHTTGIPFIDKDPDPGLNCIITIPAYKESGLTTCLDSLNNCDKSGFTTEVIILINLPENASEEIMAISRESYKTVQAWIGRNRRNDIHYHLIYADNLPLKHFGAGLARKMVMDEAISRFNKIGNTEGILLSLDADTTVAPNYITAIEEHFRKNPGASGCAIHFEHPLQGSKYPEEVYLAIRNYELHLRYYLKALRYTGYPYAFHTIGSCFAVKAGVYCKQGGMNKRKAGEDFYFIQKVAMQGNFTECNATTVYPSPRPSDRVVFGTGPEIIRQVKNPGRPYLTYAPELFIHLKLFYNNVGSLYKTSDIEAFLHLLHPILLAYLNSTDFTGQVKEIRENTASKDSFMQRFLRKFNMFWILKYLHYAEEHGVGKVEITSQAVSDSEIMK